jgi:hypothetical protein
MPSEKSVVKTSKVFTLLCISVIFVCNRGTAFCGSQCGTGGCCPCPGEAQCLGSHANCEEACGLTNGGNYNSGGTAGNPGAALMQGIMNGIIQNMNRPKTAEELEQERQRAIDIQKANEFRQQKINAYLKKQEEEKVQKERTLDKEAQDALAALTPENTTEQKTTDTCHQTINDIIDTIDGFQREAADKNLKFIGKQFGVREELIELSKDPKNKPYEIFKERIEQTRKKVSEYKEDFKRIEKCVTSKNCNLIDLNKKINKEIADWLKDEFNPRSKAARERVEEMRNFLEAFTRKIETSCETALKNQVQCQQH